MCVRLRALPNPFTLAVMFLALAVTSAAQENPLLTLRFYVDELALESSLIARFENRDEHLAEIGRRIGIEIDPGVRVGTKCAGRW